MYIHTYENNNNKQFLANACIYFVYDREYYQICSYDIACMGSTYCGVVTFYIYAKFKIAILFIDFQKK